MRTAGRCCASMWTNWCFLVPQTSTSAPCPHTAITAASTRPAPTTASATLASSWHPTTTPAWVSTAEDSPAALRHQHTPATHKLKGNQHQPGKDCTERLLCERAESYRRAGEWQTFKKALNFFVGIADFQGTPKALYSAFNPRLTCSFSSALLFPDIIPSSHDTGQNWESKESILYLCC